MRANVSPESISPVKRRTRGGSSDGRGDWRGAFAGAFGLERVTAPVVAATAGAMLMSTKIVWLGGAFVTALLGVVFWPEADAAPPVVGSGSERTVVAAATSSTIGSQLNLVNAVTIDVADGAAANDLVISGAITNSGVLTKTGTGTMILSGANTYTGNTSVNGGILSVGGSSIPNTNKLIVNGGQVKATGTEVFTEHFQLFAHRPI